MTRVTMALSDGLRAYLLAHGVREAPVLARLRAETANLGKWADMQISPEQGQLMAFLVELIGARRLLEVGTFTGYSALACALALPPGGRLDACDISEEWTAIAKRYWEEAGVADRIQLHIGPAAATLNHLLASGDAGCFDMAFIDADKIQINTYYEQCMKLVRPGGIIAIDNVLWRGAVIDADNQKEAVRMIRALNARLRDDTQITMVMLPIGDGMTLVRRRLPGEGG